MNTNEIMKPSARMLAPYFDGTISNELSGDYILPDTYPDVKKILRVKARPVPVGRFISGNRLEFSGAVDYVVVFSAEGLSGESDDKRPDTLHAVHFATEYSGAPGELENLESSEISITPRITACSARLQNPRKLSIKSTVSTDVKCSQLKPCAPKIEGASNLEDEMKLERLTATKPTLLEKRFTADHQQVSENLEPDSSQPSIDEIITCDIEVHFHDVKPTMTDDGLTVVLKGEAHVDCIYKAQGDEDDYRSFSRKIPLSYVVNADEYNEFFKDAKPETLNATATGTLTEINAVVGENSYGERRVVELDLSFDIDVRLMADTDVPMTLDAYAVDRETTCDTQRIDLSSLGKTVFANFSINEGVAREALSLPGGEDATWMIVDTQADVDITSASIARGRAQLTGAADISCILTDQNGNFTAADFSLPVKCELNVGDLSEPVTFDCACTVSDLRARLDPNRMNCDFEVSLNVVFIKKSRIDAVQTVHIAKEPRASEPESASYVLCYPSDGESIWQIAKRYNTTMGAIAAFNPSVSENPHVIMIPAGKGPAVSRII